MIFVSIISNKKTKAPVAQLDRAPDYGSGGRGFKSCRACFFIKAGFEVRERFVLKAISIQYKAENLDDFLSERREPTQGVSLRRTKGTYARSEPEAND